MKNQCVYLVAVGKVKTIAWSEWRLRPWKPLNGHLDQPERLLQLPWSGGVRSHKDRFGLGTDLRPRAGNTATRDSMAQRRCQVYLFTIDRISNSSRGFVGL